jgi:phosphatidylglycerophosphate synthase
MTDHAIEETGQRQATTARLVVDVREAATGGADIGRAVLGLPLLRRTALAASRSGFAEIVVLIDREGRERALSLLRGVPGVAVWETLPRGGMESKPTAYVPARILGEREWLEPLVRHAVADRACSSAPGGVVLCGRDVALDRLPECGGIDRASQAPALSPPPLAIVTDADLKIAEKRLLHALRKDTDGFMARLAERPISLAITRHLAATSLSPNWMTIVSVLVGLVGAPFFLSAAWLWQTVGALLFLAHSILDGCDGELARLKFQESRWGGILDFWGDNVVHVAVFACLGVGWSLAEGAMWPLLPGAAAAGATLASAGFIYFYVMRRKSDAGPLYTSVSREPARPLSRLLDSLSRRDFIYLVLLLSIFGKATWFLAASAVGTPIFFILLIVAATRARSGLARG